MKIEFTDGYIEVKESGNTYVGAVAHEFMHLASKFSRDNGIGFQDALMMHIKENGKHPNDGHIVQLIADCIANEA